MTDSAVDPGSADAEIDQAGPAEAAARFRALDRKVYMSLDDAELLSRALAHSMRQLDPPVELLVGLANGALLTTKVVGDELRLPFRFTRVRRKGSRIKQRLAVFKKMLALPTWISGSHPFGLVSRAFDRRFSKIESGDTGGLGDDIAGRVVAIVDDCIDTGSSVRYVYDRLKQAGAAHVHVCVLCWSNNTETVLGDSPGMCFLHRRIHYYPWSNNSPHYRRFEQWLAASGLRLWQ